MSQRLALLKAILANPDDDLVRLVYADWLNENGTTDADLARAEFIRLGCKMTIKAKIASAETKWIDANWQRLLGATVIARPKGAKLPKPSRSGRFLRLEFRWVEAGRQRVTDLVFEFVRGFARRVEFTNGHGYQRFWQATATDESLAYHRPEQRPDLHFGAVAVYARLLPSTWGDEVYERAIGFSEECGGKEKLYRDVVSGTAGPGGFHPLAVADEHGIDAPQHRVRAAVATAMTARAREYVGLTSA